MSPATHSKSSAAPIFPNLPLFDLEICCIPSPEFKSLTLESLHQQAPAHLYQYQSEETSGSASTPLLTPEGERHLFRAWNFLKFVLRRELARFRKQGGHRTSPEQLEQLWNEARAIQSQIVQANLRLVMKLAHKYAPTSEDVDDFISDGNLILLNAVEKFDYSRGYRFSTYATHAVSRHYFRLLHRRQRRRRQEVSLTAESLVHLAAPEEEHSPYDDALAEQLIRHFDDCLNPRERSILEQRFGLQGDSAATLKSVAGSIGLSKERVRQLQRSALDKLQSLAADLRLHPEACL